MLGAPPKERWWLHAVLFLATFLTMWMAGAMLAGVAPGVPAIRLSELPNVGRALLDWLIRLRPGLEFAMGLMAILLAHETGHYLTAKHYGINASPPYFLPAPPLWNFVGTFGAFIRLRSPVVDRQQLLDVGAAGPWAGFVVAMIMLATGMLASQPVPALEASAPQLVMLGGTPLYLGDSLAMAAARHLFADGNVVLLHPLALAGWLGLLALGPWFWGWYVWAGFTLLLGRGSLVHPTVLDRYRRLPAGRQPFGWASALLFVATFTPVPFYI